MNRLLYFIPFVTILLFSCGKESIDYREKYVGTYEGVCYSYVHFAGMDTNGLIFTDSILDTFAINSVVSLKENRFTEVSIAVLFASIVNYEAQVLVNRTGNFYLDTEMGSRQYCYGEFKGDSLTMIHGENQNTLQTKYMINAIRSN